MSDNAGVSTLDADPGMKAIRDLIDSHCKGSAPKGLIISYTFAPHTDASSITMAKRIRQMGLEVDVIAQEMGTLRRIDPDLTMLVSEHVRTMHRLTTAPSFSAWASIKDYVLRGYARIAPAIRRGEYTFIYSRVMFPAPHFLAAYVKLRHPDILWIAEYSDPARHDVQGELRPSPEIPRDAVSSALTSDAPSSVARLLLRNPDVMSWCEILGIGLADRVLFTNSIQRQVMLDPYRAALDVGVSNERFQVSPHPTLPPEFYSRTVEEGDGPSGDHFNIGYFGEFYPNRGVGELLSAMASLDSKQSHKIAVHIFTANSILARESLKDRAYKRLNVKIHPALKLMDFLAMAKRFDALYLSDVAPGSGYVVNPYLPSKISDYMGAGVPIIASIWPGSALSAAGGIEKSLIGDQKGLARVVIRLMRENWCPGKRQ